MTGAPFANPQAAARALLMSVPDLTRRSGQFLGGVMFDPAPLTEKQDRWLQDLLRKAGLPPLQTGEAHNG